MSPQGATDSRNEIPNHVAPAMAATLVPARCVVAPILALQVSGAVRESESERARATARRPSKWAKVICLSGVGLGPIRAVVILIAGIA